jgi:hypothetical protein
MPEIQRRKQTWAGTTLNKAQNSVFLMEIAEPENEVYVVVKCRTLSLHLKKVFFPL